jgi:hypothetical protein
VLFETKRSDSAAEVEEVRDLIPETEQDRADGCNYLLRQVSSLICIRQSREKRRIRVGAILAGVGESLS